MDKSFNEWPPRADGETNNETIEQKRDRLGKIIELLTNPKAVINARDILTGKNIPSLAESESQKIIFLSETVIQQKQRGDINMDKLFKGTGHIAQSSKGTSFDNVPISDTLRAVQVSDEALLKELLSLQDEELVELGIQARHTKIDEKTTEHRFRNILNTSGELMHYLGEVAYRGTK